MGTYTTSHLIMKRDGTAHSIFAPISWGGICTEKDQREGYLVAPGFCGAEILARSAARIQKIRDDVVASGDFGDSLEVESDKVEGQVLTRPIYNPYD